MLGVLVLAIGLLAWLVQRDHGQDSSTAPHGRPAFGLTVSRQPGETALQAAARTRETYGSVGLARVYSDEFPPSWAEMRRDYGDASVLVSFKIEPADVLNGSYDDRLRAWFADAPADRVNFWSYFHEPENDVEAGRFTTDEFRQAWQHIADLAAQSAPRSLKSTLILMCYSLRPASGRVWQDYVPEPATDVDVLAWDCYNHGSERGEYVRPVRMLHDAVDAAASVGAQWGVAELGSRLAVGDDGSGRAAWLDAIAAYATAQGAAFVTYYDVDRGPNGDFRLSDDPSISAWSEAIEG